MTSPALLSQSSNVILISQASEGTSISFHPITPQNPPETQNTDVAKIKQSLDPPNKTLHGLKAPISHRTPQNWPPNPTSFPKVRESHKQASGSHVKDKD